MHKIFIILLPILFLPGYLFAQQDTLIKMNGLTEKLKSSNPDIYTGATQVYNANQKIKFARSALLPKLNIWRVASIIIDWKSVADILTQDVIPFLVPSNWLKMKESKILYEATNEGFHSLQKNTIFQTKLMYLQLQQEIYQRLLQEDYLLSIDKMLATLDGQTHFNNSMSQTYRDLSYKKSVLQMDILKLENLILEERNLLSMALGLKPNELLMPEEINPVLLKKSSNMNYIKDYNTDVLLYSCELKEFDSLIKVAPKVKGEIYWNLLGVTNISRGAAGGIFDEIPIQDGLGFGKNTSLRIHKKQLDLLNKQREGIAQILLRQVDTISSNFKFLEQQKAISFEKLALLEIDHEQLQLESIFGTNFNPLKLSETEQKIVLTKILIANLSLALFSEQEKLKRLYEQDDYSIIH